MQKVAAVSKNHMEVKNSDTSLLQITVTLMDKLNVLTRTRGIRKISAKDNLEIKEKIQSLLLKQGGVGIDKLYYDTELSDLTEAYSEDQSHFLVLVDKKEIQGTIGMTMSYYGGQPTCELKKIYSFRDNEEDFIQLISKAKAWARKSSFEKSVAKVEYRNKHLINALIKSGFALDQYDQSSSYMVGNLY